MSLATYRPSVDLSLRFVLASGSVLSARERSLISSGA